MREEIGFRMGDRMRLSKWGILGGLLGLAVLGGCSAKIAQNESVGETVEEKKMTQMKIGERQLNVEVADTPEKITKGLGYRDEIGSEGMLFVFPRAHVPSFWMKGMRIGLDFIWIGKCSDEESGRVAKCEVVDVTERVKAPEEPEDWVNLKQFSPRSEVKYVLEVDLGKVEEWGIGIGNKVEITN